MLFTEINWRKTNIINKKAYRYQRLFYRNPQYLIYYIEFESNNVRYDLHGSNTTDLILIHMTLQAFIFTFSKTSSLTQC